MSASMGTFFRESVALYAVISCSLPHLCIFWFIYGNSRVAKYVHYALRVL